MTAASSQIVPDGGYNNVGLDYITPETAAQAIQVAATKTGADPYVAFDGANAQVKVDKIVPFTASAGVLVDGVKVKIANISASLPLFTDSSKAVITKSVADTCTALGVTPTASLTPAAIGAAAASALTSHTGTTGNAHSLSMANLSTIGAAAKGANSDITSMTGLTGGITTYAAATAFDPLPVPLSGSMTFVTQGGRYFTVGKMVFFSVYLGWSTCGSSPAGINCTVPAASSAAIVFGGGAYLSDAGNSKAATWRLGGGSTNLVIQPDNSTITTGAAGELWVTGWYEKA
jgi:hypothetical protein